VYCLYFQALVNVRKTWFIGGVFRNEDYVAFERTLEGTNDIIEFFVPPSQEQMFLYLIECLIKGGYVYELHRMPNRLFRGDLKST
jgi:hypothetical protein